MRKRKGDKPSDMFDIVVLSLVLLTTLLMVANALAGR